MLFNYAYNNAKKRAIRLNAIVKPKISAEMPGKGKGKPRKAGGTKDKGKKTRRDKRSSKRSPLKKTHEHE